MFKTKTSILIDANTRKRLSEIGKKYQTYNDIIIELIESNNKLDSLEKGSGESQSSESYNP
jgi:hypothetical protein